MLDVKICNRCNESLTLANFYAEKSAKDGRRTICKSCDNQLKANYYSKNKTKVKQNVAQWKEQNPQKVKKYAQKYFQNIKARDKDKRSAEFKNWRLENPEKDKDRSHRRRARLRNAKTFSVTSKEIKLLLLKPCFYCGNKSSQIDHIVPLSRGGTHGIGNLIQACAPCNHSKKDKLIMEWRTR